MSKNTLLPRQRRKNKIRAKVSWTLFRPRISVTKSLRFIKVQAIDDEAWKTLFYAQAKKSEAWAKEVGKKIAKDWWFSEAVFDRNWYIYHWLVKALADEARTWGIKF